MTHDLQTFFILHNFFGRVAVHHRPILAGRNGHAGDDEILLKLIKRSGCAGAARGDNGAGGLSAHQARSAVEHSVHQAGDAAAGRGVMHRETKDEAVRGFTLFQAAVDGIVIVYAAILLQLEACAAAGTAANGVAAQLEDSASIPSSFSTRSISQSAVYVQPFSCGLPLIKSTFIKNILSVIKFSFYIIPAGRFVCKRVKK